MMPISANLLVFAVGLIIILVVVVREERRRHRLFEPRGRMEAAWGGEERRRHPRIRCAGIVRYHREEALKPPAGDTTAPLFDVSLGGIAARLPERLPPGLLIACEIVAQHRETIHGRGEVRWRKEVRRSHLRAPREFLTGIQFRDIDPSDVSRWQALVQQQQSASGNKER